MPKNSSATGHPRLEFAAVLALCLLAITVLADVLLGWFSVPAAAVEHALVQAVLWPFVLADTTEMLPHKPFKVVLQGLGTGLLGWFIARWADRGHTSARVLFDVVFAAPSLLVVCAITGAGLALAPPVVLGCLAAGVFGIITARSEGSPTAPRPLSGLPAGPARWILLGAAGLGFTLAGTVLASGPGDSQVPFAALAALEGSLPAVSWSWLVSAGALGLLFLSKPRGARAGAVLVAGALGVVVTLVFVAGTAPEGQGLRRALAAVPLPLVTAALGSRLSFHTQPALSWRPTLWVLRLGLPLAAALLGILHTATTGFLGCEQVYEHDAVTVLSREPGAFAVQPIPASAGGPAVVVAFRDAETLRLIPLAGGAVVEHDLNDLPLSAWEQAPPPLRNAYPEELGLDPQGRVHIWVEVPPPGDERVRLLMDASTGEILDVRELPDACFVSSWLWDGDRAVSGCEWEGDLMIEQGDTLTRASVDGAGELEELVQAPDGTGWFAVSLWSHPYLVKIDPATLTTIARTFVGSFNWGLGADPASHVLAVPRFIAGQVLFVDADTLRPRSSVRAGWGLRPIVKAPQAWLTASTYDGTLYAVHEQRGLVGQLRLGGWVRDIDLLDERTLVAGGMCGVMTVDLEEWLR